ncbi:MAG: cache domain-containing protein [Patescibacteria group bacterium]|nr:cache domain-containing protein [Patescibacteria group bacterium]
MKIFFRPTKEMVFIIAIAILPVSVFGFIAVNRSVEVAQIVAEEEDKIIADHFADEVSLYLKRSQDIIKSLSAISFENINENSLKAVYENNDFRNIPIFESLALVDEEGRLILIYPTKKELISLDYSRRPFFDFVKRENKTFFSGVGFSPVTEQPVIEIAVPVFSENQGTSSVGVLTGSIRLQGLSFLVSAFSLPSSTGQAFLLGQFGEIIAHPDYRLIREQENIANVYPELTIALQEATEAEETFRYSSSDGIEYLVGFQTVSPTNWILVTRQEISEVLAVPRQLGRFLSISLVATFAIAGVLSFRIASFIKQLEEERDREREKRVKELEEIRDTLEIRVKARSKELEDLVANLDAEVKIRTKELQDRMKDLEKFRKFAVGRELKMIELKKKMKGLENKTKKSKIDQQ